VIYKLEQSVYQHQRQIESSTTPELQVNTDYHYQIKSKQIVRHFDIYRQGKLAVVNNCRDHLLPLPLIGRWFTTYR